MRLSEPTVGGWRTTRTPGTRDFLGGLALATAFVCLTPSGGPPYPDFFGISTESERSLAMGWLSDCWGSWPTGTRFVGDASPSGQGNGSGSPQPLFFSQVPGFRPPSQVALLGQQAFVLLLACCLIECGMSIMSTGLLFAKLFTRNRPGAAWRLLARTFWVSSSVPSRGRFAFWQFAAGMMSI